MPEVWMRGVWQRLSADSLILHHIMKPSFTRREFLQTAGAATLATMAAPSVLAQATPKITVAFAGVCHIHAPGYLTLAKQRTDVKIKSIWDGDSQRATRAAPQFGATPVSDVGSSDVPGRGSTSGATW